MSIEHLRPQARYVNEAHRLRAYRKAQKPVRSDDPTPTPGNGPVRVSRAQQVAQMTPEQMHARLDALAREFDARGSTEAMRQEGRALAKALDLPRPRWLPRGDE
jgi:hypothetical protein